MSHHPGKEPSGGYQCNWGRPCSFFFFVIFHLFTYSCLLLTPPMKNNPSLYSLIMTLSPKSPEIMILKQAEGLGLVVAARGHLLYGWVHKAKEKETCGWETHSFFPWSTQALFCFPEIINFSKRDLPGWDSFTCRWHYSSGASIALSLSGSIRPFSAPLLSLRLHVSLPPILGKLLAWQP